MSTRYNIKQQRGEHVQTGYDTHDIPEDFVLPSCGVEDVDKAIFKLFNEELPMTIELEGETRRIPVIFATGERAFILRRKQPLRDKQGALILPLISILRSGIDQNPSVQPAMGPGIGQFVIKRSVSSENDIYKRRINPNGISNQPSISTNNKHSAGPSSRITYNRGTISLETTKENVYEFLTIPIPRFFTATYEISFWSQYLQQMNKIQEALMTSYNINASRSFRIESDKGYWFVATVDSGINLDQNFDSFQDEERIIKSSVTINVNGYIINPPFDGAISPVRRSYSSPRVSFESVFSELDVPPTSPIKSGDPKDYTLQDLTGVDDEYPGSAIGFLYDDGNNVVANIGGKTAGSETITRVITDPFNQQSKRVKVAVKTNNEKKGETVYRKLWTL